MKKYKITFYCKDTLSNIESMEYYKQDIEILRALGHTVTICNRYRDITWNFDIIYIWWWTYALIPILISRILGRKAVVTGVFNFRLPRDFEGIDYFRRPWHQRLLLSLGAKGANANFFISKDEFRQVPEHFHLQHSAYTPCSIGKEYFSTKIKTEVIPQLLNIAWSGISNLKRKGVFDVLEAAALLRKQGVRFRLVLAGKQGDGYSLLQERILANSLEDCVELVGEISKQRKLDLLSRTHIYLQPSYYEGFGLATAEAMASGCCVVTCDVGEVRNVVGDCGIYVQPGNPQMLAHAVADILKDPSGTRALGEKSRLRISEHFSQQSKQAQLQSAVDSIMCGDSR